MSLDFAPGAWLDTRPLPDLPIPAPAPWQPSRGEAEYRRGLESVETIKTAIAGRSGRAVGVVERTMAWAVEGLETSYKAKDGAGVRQYASVLILTAGNATEATNPLLPWWEIKEPEPDAYEKYRIAIDEFRAWAGGECGGCGSEAFIHVWVTFKNGTKHIRIECAKCGKHQRFTKQNQKAKDAADEHERRPPRHETRYLFV